MKHMFFLPQNDQNKNCLTLCIAVSNSYFQLLSESSRFFDENYAENTTDYADYAKIKERTVHLQETTNHIFCCERYLDDVEELNSNANPSRSVDGHFGCVKERNVSHRQIEE